MSEQPATPFPMQPYKQQNGVEVPKSYIPMWLAKIAYVRWVMHNQSAVVSMEKIAENGGFGPMVLLDLLAGGTGKKPYDAFRAMISRREVSVKDQVQIVTAGSPEYHAAMRDFEKEKASKEKAPTQVFYQNGGGLVDKR